MRLPTDLASKVAEHGRRSGLSQNEALVRLAEVGAAQQAKVDAIARRGERRLAAWQNLRVASSDEHATAEELAAAVELARGDDVTEDRS